VDVWIALLPVDCVELVDDAFFCCPEAFPEFPGAAPWEAVSVAGAIGAAALPLPLPFPARAEPVTNKPYGYGLQKIFAWI